MMSKVLVHICPDCQDEFTTEKRLVDHLNEVHDYGWSYEEYQQICGNMNNEWRSIQSCKEKVN